jgi:hypothetical protein
MLGLGLREGCGCGGRTYNLAAVGADGLLGGSQAGNEITEGWHLGSKAPGEMGPVELSTTVL